MRAAPRLPDRGVVDARVDRVEHEIAGAGVLVAVKDQVPRNSAGFATVDAAFFVRTVGVTERGDVDDIGIGRVDAHLGDVAGFGQPEMRPGIAGVGRFVDAVAVGNVTANRCLTHSGVDHVRIGVGDGQRADRGALEEAVRY